MTLTIIKKNARGIGSWWWLRTAATVRSHDVWSVNDDGSRHCCYVTYKGGIRPVLSFKL